MNTSAFAIRSMTKSAEKNHMRVGTAASAAVDRLYQTPWIIFWCTCNAPHGLPPDNVSSSLASEEDGARENTAGQHLPAESITLF